MCNSITTRLYEIYYIAHGARGVGIVRPFWDTLDALYFFYISTINFH